MNGVRLDAGDYTATNGTSVVLDTTAVSGDVVFILALDTFELADHYSKTASDARYLQSVASNSIGATELNVSGNGTSGQYLGSDGDGTMTWTSISSDPTMGGDLSGTASNAQIASNTVGASEINVSGNGTSGQLLTSDGDGTMSWTTAGAGGVESGTKMLFWQASAPNDWTQDTTHNNKGLRVVSGTGGGNGGTTDWTSPTGGTHTLSTAQMPSHNHSVSMYESCCENNVFGSGWSGGTQRSAVTHSKGGGSSHSHSVNVLKYVDVIICTKD